MHHPAHSEYNLRSNLPPGGKGRPERIDVHGANPQIMPTGSADRFVMEKDGVTRKVLNRSIVPVSKVPRVPGTQVHTMFEDSEAMVMHLTAALLSTCGKKVIKTLSDRGPVSKLSVGLFSKTAVEAVKRKVTAVGAGEGSPQTLLRTADTNKARKVTGTFTKTTKAIDHIVLVMCCSATSDLIIVTCYPSPVPTTATIGTSNAPNLDIEEHVIVTHITKACQQGGGLPDLVW